MELIEPLIVLLSAAAAARGKRSGRYEWGDDCAEHGLPVAGDQSWFRDQGHEFPLQMSAHAEVQWVEASYHASTRF